MPKNCHKSNNNHKRRNTISSIWPFQNFVNLASLKQPHISVVRQKYAAVSGYNLAIPKKLKDKLQKFQNRAARIIVGASYEIRSADVLQSLAWDNLETRRRTTKAILMFKVLKDYIGPTILDNTLWTTHRIWPRMAFFLNNYPPAPPSQC